MVIVLSIDNKKAGEVKLPDAFSQQLNEKVLKRAYLAEESENFQLKYPDPLAGMRKSAELTKRRRSYKTTYGGNTRTPKKTLQHVGSHFSYVGAVAPNTVGGREAHPPKAERRLVKKINKQERQLAIRIGIAGSAKKELVSKFHKIDGLNELPLVLEDKINVLEKTKDALKVLAGVGLSVELDRVMKRSIRAGKGKLRGRKSREN
jgi:Ribosomal protein L4